MLPFGRKTRPPRPDDGGDLLASVGVRDPLTLVPEVEPGTETRWDHEGRAQIRRRLEPRPGLGRWIARRLHYSRDIRVNLDATGSYIWQRMDGRCDLRTLAESLQEDHDYPRRQANEAVLRFARMLIGRRLIVLQGRQAHPAADSQQGAAPDG